MQPQVGPENELSNIRRRLSWLLGFIGIIGVILLAIAATGGVPLFDPTFLELGSQIAIATAGGFILAIASVLLLRGQPMLSRRFRILGLIFVAGGILFTVGVTGGWPIQQAFTLSGEASLALAAAGSLGMGFSGVALARAYLIGVCEIDGTDLYYVGRRGGLYICCSATERHCWEA